MNLLKILRDMIVRILLLPIQIIAFIPLMVALELVCPRSEMKAMEAELERMKESDKKIDELFKECSRMSIKDLLERLEEIHKVYGLPTNPFSLAYEQLADIMGSISTDPRLQKSHCEKMAEMLVWKDIQNVWLDCIVRLHILNALERFPMPDKFDPYSYLEHLKSQECGWKNFRRIEVIIQEEHKIDELITIYEENNKFSSFSL